MTAAFGLAVNKKESQASRMDGPITLDYMLGVLANLKTQRDLHVKFFSDEVCVGHARADPRVLCAAGIPWGTGLDGMILLSSSSMKSARELGLVR